MMLFAVRRHTPSDYPFLFRYAASRTEEDGATVKNLAAAVHLLQSSTIITDDILDAGSPDCFAGASTIIWVDACRDSTNAIPGQWRNG